MVTAITTWTANATAAPAQTTAGRPRVDITNDANIVLSGSSPRKMIGNTAMATAGCTGSFLTASTVVPLHGAAGALWARRRTLA